MRQSLCSYHAKTLASVIAILYMAVLAHGAASALMAHGHATDFQSPQCLAVQHDMNATVLMTSGHREEAFLEYSKAGFEYHACGLGLQEAKRHATAATAYHHAAWAYARCGQQHVSAQMYEKAAKMYEKSKKYLTAARAFESSAESYEARGDYKSAMRVYFAAGRVYSAIKYSKYALIRITEDLQRVYHQQQRLEQIRKRNPTLL